jgi:cytochrome c2
LKGLIATSIVLVAALLIGFNWQRSWAQQANSDSSPQTEVPHVIKIPPVGYKPAAKSEQSEKGSRLFQDLNCMACHSIHNVGGDFAPALDGVGSRRSESFMLAHLSNAPEAQQQYQSMRGTPISEGFPHARFSPETAKLLIAYLQTLPEPPGGFVVMPHTVRLPAEPLPEHKSFIPAKPTAASAEGETMFNKFGCVACHSIGDVGGWVGPKLDGVGARRSAAYIQAHVTDAQAHAKLLSHGDEEVESKMPRFAISADEAQKITDYLLTLPNSK